MISLLSPDDSFASGSPTRKTHDKTSQTRRSSNSSGNPVRKTNYKIHTRGSSKSSILCRL